MSGDNRKWAALFLFLIVLPAAALTYLSARSFQSEQRAALVALNLLVPRLQENLDRLLEELSARAAATSPDSLSLPGIESALLLDAGGRPLYPPYLPLELAARTPAFAAAMSEGQEREFGARDWQTAGQAYARARTLARHLREEAEALGALQRVALRQERLPEALDLHRLLDRDHASVLDADGAHQLGLSYLRLAARLPAEQGLALLDQWARGLLQGRYPLFPGIGALVDRARSERADPALHALLDRVGALARLLDMYADLVSRGLAASGYHCGTHASGESFLLQLEPRADGTTLVLHFDLQELAALLSESAPGLELAQGGFGLALFDADNAARFDLRRRDTTHQVVPASRSIYRLHLGIFARDEAFVLRNYRNRNLFITAGIFLLAGAIAGGAFLIFRDTTRQIQTARLRAEFVANVSHELRTPLTSIRMHAETLLLGRYRSQEQVQDYLNTIMQESQRLSRMVGNVLDFSRMESGRKTYDFAAVDLGELARQVAVEFAPLLEERGFAFSLDIASDLPPVRADAEALATALANLLGNAVKYSRERLDIALSVRREGSWQIAEVADRGIGVPAGEGDLIFEKFHRAANAAGAATGTGLGLALVSGIARSHGGRAGYAPREGGGSVFRLELPCTED